MVQQTDIDQLQVELEQLKFKIQRKRKDVANEVQTMLNRAGELRERSRGGVYEPAVTIVVNMLEALDRGVKAQASLNAVLTD